MPFMEGYASNSTGSMTATNVQLQQPQRQREIPAKLELVDKLLHELHEESIGMNGTFANALSSAAPTAGSAEPQTAHASGLGEVLDGFAVRIQQAIAVLRDVRLRCEL